MIGGTIQAALARVRPGSKSQRIHEFCELSRMSHRRRPASRVSESRRRLLSVQRRRGRRARAAGARASSAIAIVDLDVHHGNGTAFIFESDPRVFTFSMHQQHNYPMWKPRGSLDIGLPDGAHDATFLRELERALPAVMAHRPQCVFYLAGADPYEDDQLGGLRLTQGRPAPARSPGDRRRPRRRRAAVMTLAGGYARRVEDTVAIHAATIEEASRAVRRVETSMQSTQTVTRGRSMTAFSLTGARSASARRRSSDRRSRRAPPSRAPRRSDTSAS